jgi:hypothetical protein
MPGRFGRRRGGSNVAGRCARIRNPRARAMCMREEVKRRRGQGGGSQAPEVDRGPQY